MTNFIKNALDSKASVVQLMTVTDAAVAAHVAASDPHPGYLTAAEGNAAYEPIGLVAAHAAAADPHVGYQKESEKAVAGGYASLDGSGLVPLSQIPGVPVLMHAITHVSGGSDPIKLDDFAAPDDNTDLDASTAKHGLMKKFPGGTTNFLREDGTFAAPTATASDLAYAPGSFTIATGKFRFQLGRMILTGAERGVLQGSARIRITGSHPNG